MVCSATVAHAANTIKLTQHEQIRKLPSRLVYSLRAAVRRRKPCSRIDFIDRPVVDMFVWRSVEDVWRQILLSPSRHLAGPCNLLQRGRVECNA